MLLLFMLIKETMKLFFLGPKDNIRLMKNEILHFNVIFFINLLFANLFASE